VYDIKQNNNNNDDDDDDDIIIISIIIYVKPTLPQYNLWLPISYIIGYQDETKY